MKTRKIALIAGIGVLACIYVLQVINAHRSPIKEFTLKETPDTVTITSDAKGTVTLTNENGGIYTYLEKIGVI